MQPDHNDFLNNFWVKNLYSLYWKSDCKSIFRFTYLIVQANPEMEKNIIHNLNAVTHSNTAARDNCFVITIWYLIKFSDFQVSDQKSVPLTEMTQFMLESEICNIKVRSPDWEIDSDQDTVDQKLSNTATSQIETLDCLVGNIKEDPVIQKLPETNTNDVDKAQWSKIIKIVWKFSYYFRAFLGLCKFFQ